MADQTRLRVLSGLLLPLAVARRGCAAPPLPRPSSPCERRVIVCVCVFVCKSLVRVREREGPGTRGEGEARGGCEGGRPGPRGPSSFPFDVLFFLVPLSFLPLFLSSSLFLSPFLSPFLSLPLSSLRSPSLLSLSPLPPGLAPAPPRPTARLPPRPGSRPAGQGRVPLRLLPTLDAADPPLAGKPACALDPRATLEAAAERPGWALASGAALRGKLG